MFQDPWLEKVSSLSDMKRMIGTRKMETEIDLTFERSEGTEILPSILACSLHGVDTVLPRRHRIACDLCLLKTLSTKVVCQKSGSWKTKIPTSFSRCTVGTFRDLFFPPFCEIVFAQPRSRTVVIAQQESGKLPFPPRLQSLFSPSDFLENPYTELRCSRHRIVLGLVDESTTSLLEAGG